MNQDGELQKQLIAIAQSSSWFMQALFAVQQLGLEHWCIGAGAIRNLVWDYLHEYTTPSTLSDIDVVYFDAKKLSVEHDKELQCKLSLMVPEQKWEVVNQAAIHLWLERNAEYKVQPFQSLEEGVASWPEYATCVGIKLQPDNSLHVIAPHGLQDLFACRVQYNPTRVNPEVFRQRVHQKQFSHRWPKVNVVSI